MQDLLNRYYNSLDDREKLIFDPIISLPNSKIDFLNSEINHKNEFKILKINSLENKNCSFELYLGTIKNKNIINFYIGKGAGVFIYEDFSISTNDYFKYIKEVIDCFLKYEVYSEEYFFKDNILNKVVYFMDCNLKYIYSSKSSWFWNKRIKKIKKYESWYCK